MADEGFDFSELERELKDSDLEVARAQALEINKLARVVAALAIEAGGELEVDFEVMSTLPPVTLYWHLSEDGKTLTVRTVTP